MSKNENQTPEWDELRSSTSGGEFEPRLESMLQAIGSVECVLRNIDTMEIEGVYKQDNMILDQLYNRITTSQRIGPNILIGSSTVPIFRFNDLISSRQSFAIGYLDPATPSPTWFDAVGQIPAYVQFKNRFDPPASGSRTITNVGLTDLSAANLAYMVVNGNLDNLQSMLAFAMHTALLLGTPCVQSSTQVLDIFYRIQWIIPASPAIDSMHLIRAAKFFSGFGVVGNPDFAYTSPLAFGPNVNRKMVSIPYIIGGNYSWTSFPKANDIATTTFTNDTRLFKRKAAWSQTLSDDVGKIFGTYLFGGGKTEFGTVTNVIPVINVIPGSTSGSNIQPVHNHSALATVPFIDVNTLANGSGTVVPTEQAGGWTSTTKHPELYKINMTAGGDVGVSTYNFSVRRHLGFYGNTFDNRHEVVPFFTDETQPANYPTAVHGIVPALPYGSTTQKPDLAERFDIDSLITANASGVTLSNITTGDFRSWDATTTPALSATAITDIRYNATSQTLWVACSATGLYTIRMIAPFTVTKITTPPAPANVNNCYAIDFGYNGYIWAVFKDAICSSADSGATWTAYHPTSTPPFSFTDISDDNWSTVKYIRCDRSSPQHQILIVRDNATSINNGFGSAWWSVSAPDITANHRYWRMVSHCSVSTLVYRITQTQFKNAAGTNLTGSGTALSSLTTTTAASAFDQSGTTYFEASAARSTNSIWLGYDFGSPVNVRSVSFKTTASSTVDSIWNHLQYSDDGITWVTVSYLGTSSGTAINTRYVNTQPLTTYNLVQLTWPTAATGPNIPLSRINRLGTGAVPYSTHFINLKFDGIFILNFGSTVAHPAGPMLSGQSATVPSLMLETDPVTGSTGIFVVCYSVSSSYSTAISLSSSIRTGLFEGITANATQNNIVPGTSGSGVDCFYPDSVHRHVYMGKGEISYLASAGGISPPSQPYNQWASILVVGQVALRNDLIDGGPLKSIVWDSYGWNGTQWVLGGTGSKTTHSTSNALVNGIKIQFANAASGTSFAVGDYFNFGVNRGVFKDNATTFAGNYSFYFKPVIHNVPYFSTPTVQQIFGQTGVPAVYFATRGVTVDPAQFTPLICTGVNTGGGSYYAQQLLFGDFQVDFALPAGSVPTGTTVGFGLINPSFVSGQNFASPVAEVDSYNMYSVLAAPVIIRIKGSGATSISGTLIAPGKVYSIRRVAGVIKYYQDGVLFYTAPAADNTRAFRPYVNMSCPTNLVYSLMPSMNIISNSTAWAAYCGSSATTTGVYDPNFYAADDSTLSTFNVLLDGAQPLIKYTSYATPTIGINEVLVDGRSGIIFFSPSDVGKTISGTFTQINNV